MVSVTICRGERALLMPRCPKIKETWQDVAFDVPLVLLVSAQFPLTR